MSMVPDGTLIYWTLAQCRPKAQCASVRQRFGLVLARVWFLRKGGIGRNAEDLHDHSGENLPGQTSGIVTCRLFHHGCCFAL